MINVIEYDETKQTELENLIYELKKCLSVIDPLHLNKIQPEFKKTYLDDLLKEVNSNNGKIYMVVYDKQVVGYVAGIVIDYSDNFKTHYIGEKTGVILELYVKEKHRELNILTALLERIEEHFMENKCNEIRANVFATNQIARNFYIRRGFSERNISMIKKI